MNDRERLDRIAQTVGEIFKCQGWTEALQEPGSVADWMGPRLSRIFDLATLSRAAALLEANGWTLEQTGGGCTAYTKPDDGNSYWMLTRPDGGSVPELMTEPITVGLYWRDSSDAADLTDYATLQQWADSHYLQQPTACPRCGESTTCPLHAAAAQMLAALKMLVGNPDYAQHMTVGDMDIARAAIAKAEAPPSPPALDPARALSQAG